MKWLVIAEKPSACKDYAKVLNCIYNRESRVYENDEFIVTHAVGHLFSLKEPQDYNPKYAKWSLDDLPIIPDKFEIKMINATREQYKIIETQIKRNDVVGIINGGDPGREGELIQREILNYSKTKKPVKRLWLPSLTEEEIAAGFKNLKEASDYDNLYYAAEARNILDILTGFNYTRGYTLAKGNGVLLSVGRCQTPTLNLIVQRDIERESFNSTAYFEIEVNFDDYKSKYFLNNDTKILLKETATQIFNKIEGKQGKIIKVTKEEREVPPPMLHSLDTLQTTMNSKYGFSSSKTLKVAQSLYETHKILSYPRTESQHVSESTAKEFKKRLSCIKYDSFKIAIDRIDLDNLKHDKRFVDNTKLTDHHAIIPTDNKEMCKIYKELTEDERALFNEVALTFISCFYPPYRYENTSIITEVESHTFRTNTNVVLQKGWKEIYQEAQEEEGSNEEYPELDKSFTEGQIEAVKKAGILTKKTAAKRQYTEGALIKELKKFGIGTSATRNNIIDTLIKRGFIERQGKSGKELVSTKLGKDFISVIDTKELKSVELTAELERKLEAIAKGELTKESVVNEAIESLKKNIAALISYDGDTIGEEKFLGTCPLCKEGEITANKTGWGCSKYEENECKFFIRRELGGKKIKSEQVKKLIQSGRTDIIQGFKKKDSEDMFDAALIVEGQEIKLEIAKPEDLGVCPECGKGHIITKTKGWGCNKYSETKCPFFLYYEIAGKKITLTQAKKIVENGKTDTIKGFKKKDSEDIFDAALMWDNEKKKIIYTFSTSTGTKKSFGAKKKAAPKMKFKM